MKLWAHLAILTMPVLVYGQTADLSTGSSFPSTDFRDLILKAMHAKEGKSHVDLQGSVADMIRQQINHPNARVSAEVTTVEELKDDGCKRFQIRFTTPGTLLPMSDGSSQMFDMSMFLNMCKNGMPPGIADDAELTVRMHKAQQEDAARFEKMREESLKNPQKK